MVNFKCCPNIFVIFWVKKWINILWFFFLQKKKKMHFTTWQMPLADYRPCGLWSMWPQSAAWNIIHVADSWHRGSKCTWHISHVDYGPRCRLLATWIKVHVAYSQPRGFNPSGQCATWIKSTGLKHQPRVYYTWHIGDVGSLDTWQIVHFTTIGSTTPSTRG